MKRRSVLVVAALCLTVPVMGAASASAAGKAPSSPPGHAVVATTKAAEVSNGKLFRSADAPVTEPAPVIDIL